MPSLATIPGQPEDVAEALRLFGNAARAAIIHELLKGPMLRTELRKSLGIPATSLALHLDVLFEAGLVSAEVGSGTGSPLIYILDRQRLRSLLIPFLAYLSEE